MNDNNGAISWSLNRKAYRLNRYVERTERHLADSLYEVFKVETSVNNPTLIQKALAMDITWKISIGLPYEVLGKCGACDRYECVCPEEV